MDSSSLSLPIDLRVDAIRDICRKYGVRELSVFGSVLWLDFTDQSDLDLLAELAPDSSVHSLFDWIRLKHVFEDLWHRPVDLIDPEDLDPWIRDTVLAERRILYVAS